ncbi:hypothetical protein DLJ59_10530 [Micromonospora inaquosa]|uniref:Uncharacterized protein n=1 Tax=Micromonospora inaquosa TaxID=2203716 RepID=A0A3N9WTK8_9ACTN|nr:hypothetical protein DLJ59_10530 [Micromonospora inaquosa]
MPGGIRQQPRVTTRFVPGDFGICGSSRQQLIVATPTDLREMRKRLFGVRLCTRRGHSSAVEVCSYRHKVRDYIANAGHPS